MKWRSTVFSFVATLVAINYFAFRVELFEDENAANHPGGFAKAVTLTLPTLNWETFDKDNAPQAIIVDPEIKIEFLSLVGVQPPQYWVLLQSSDPVRDKSPPINPFS
jgi:hypothetical protein